MEASSIGDLDNSTEGPEFLFHNFKDTNPMSNSNDGYTIISNKAGLAL